MSSNIVAYQGMPCKHKHTRGRNRSGDCVECNRIKMAKWRAENPNYYSRQRRENLEKVRRQNREATRRHREKYPPTPHEVERRRYLNSLYKKKNPRVVNSHNAMRRASKLRATPVWADRGLIMSFYKNKPDGHHVDHIIPLKGKNVCGLHILDNLQYLPAGANLKKSNKFS